MRYELVLIGQRQYLSRGDPSGHIRSIQALGRQRQYSSRGDPSGHITSGQGPGWASTSPGQKLVSLSAGTVPGAAPTADTGPGLELAEIGHWQNSSRGDPSGQSRSTQALGRQRQNSSRGVPSGHIRSIQILAWTGMPAGDRPATLSAARVGTCVAGPAPAAANTVPSRTSKPHQ